MAGYTPHGLRGTTETGAESMSGTESSNGRKNPARPPAKCAAAGNGRAPSSVSGRTKGLGVRGWLRWIWRQLTSMRVALLLLLLLAVVAMPGAFFPQRRVNPILVNQYFEDNPALAPWLDRAYMFDVFSSPWFSAVYLLLFVSLIGCIVPRTKVHLEALRSEPTKVPARFTRFPVRSERVVHATPGQVSVRLHAAFGRRYRTKLGTEAPKGHGGAGQAKASTTPDATATSNESAIRTISAERGYGKETGNLVFHLALVGLLVVTAWGQLVHYRGQAMITEGSTFVNSALDYDFFEAGALFGADGVAPYRIRLDEFVPDFTVDAQARDFTAFVTLFETDGTTSEQTIRVNHPLTVGGSRVYLMGNGFAPDLTITDASGEVAHDGPVPFIPADDDPGYASTGVVMVPDANDGDPQVAFNGSFLPTALRDDDGAYLGSAHPLPLDPVLVLQMYTGDLGLDEGVPRSLLTLDTTDLDQVTATGDDGAQAPVQLELAPGESVELPNGHGTLTFNDLPRFVALDLRYDPSPIWQGIFATLAFGGLIAALFLPRRRIWVRLVPRADGATVVHAAALARHDDPGLRAELDRILTALPPDGARKKQ
ncbi:MAG TPA: cytochrome c biogenesis protein ResB [Beutenbergiaceae bacterium]|nr:cytochrome c biogenesis protein ResB [Beutenbergiaceae bacterium]